jgi:hypothetical protein
MIEDSHQQILSLLAIIFRLHIRLRVVHEPGVDDLFMSVAGILPCGFLWGYCSSKTRSPGQNADIPPGLEQGIGKHLIYNLDILEQTMIWFYVANAAYIMTTVCVKLSLLCQYLRLFREGYRRPLVITLLTLVSLWGGAFTFMAWFPCFPVHGFWNKRMSPPARCYGFGYRTLDEAKNTL